MIHHASSWCRLESETMTDIGVSTASVGQIATMAEQFQGYDLGPPGLSDVRPSDGVRRTSGPPRPRRAWLRTQNALSSGWLLPKAAIRHRPSILPDFAAHADERFADRTRSSATPMAASPANRRYGPVLDVDDHLTRSPGPQSGWVAFPDPSRTERGTVPSALFDLR